MIPRAIHQIFSILDANEAEYTVKCSFLELYNEETTDLLAVGDAVDAKLKMLEDSGRVVVQASIQIPPQPQGKCAVQERGLSAAAVHSTAMEHRSAP